VFVGTVRDQRRELDGFGSSLRTPRNSMVAQMGSTVLHRPVAGGDTAMIGMR